MKKKRILCSLLTLAMLMALLTVTAFAEGKEANPAALPGIDAETGRVELNSSGYYQLTNDTLSGKIWVSGSDTNVTIDLNGHTLDLSSVTGYGGIVVAKGGAVCTICDSSSDGTGKILFGDYGLSNSSVLNVMGGTFSANMCAAINSNGADLYISNARLESVNSQAVQNQGDLTAENATIISANSFGVLTLSESKTDLYNTSVSGALGIMVYSEDSNVVIHGNSKVVGSDSGIYTRYAFSEDKPVIKVADMAEVRGNNFGIYTQFGPADISVSDDAVVSGEGYTGISLWGRCVLHVSGGTIQGFTGLTSNGSNESYCDSRGSQCYISGGQIIGFQKSVGIYWPSSDYSEDIPSILEITGGTVSGGSGIFFCGGTLKVSGGEIIGTLNKMQPGDGYDGYEYVQKQYSNPDNSGSFNATGAALIVPVNRACKADTDPYQVYVVKKVEITGGTFISDGVEPAVPA